MWTRQRPGPRRPRHSLDDIAAAALRVADTEGIEAVSMRRIAAELGAGTMTLYHYVKTKDELLALLADRVMGEMLLDDLEFPDGWRACMTAIARRTRDTLVAHPWVFDIGEDPTLGPNGVAHFEQSLQALATLDLTVSERIDILQVVDEYVFGHCLHARSDAGDADSDGSVAELLDYVVELSRGGRYPELAKLLDEHGVDALWAEVRAQERDPHRFDRNIARILDGIERELPEGAERRAPAP